MKVKYFDLENKVIFITGGGSGIGASIVEHFCEQGCKVFFIDINDSESQKVIDKCKSNKFSIYVVFYFNVWCSADLTFKIIIFVFF